MTTAKDGMELTRVGPGTIMGELMRRYWIPACKSSEVERDGAPLRLVLLGEKLIAFRDSAGRVGVMDHRCPHRCASLFLGRNENGGLRCIYHGWKFDVTGRCVDMPSVAPHQDFKHKVHARAYETAERAGIVWVYMGPRAEARLDKSAEARLDKSAEAQTARVAEARLDQTADVPPLPGFEILAMPDAEVNVAFVHRACNYLQALEGEIDTSHFGFLHAGHVRVEDVAEDEPLRNTIVNRAPEYHVADTPWGTQYAGYREVAPGKTYWRFANYLFPFWTQAPNGEFQSHMHARAWVPLDDNNTMFVFIWWKQAKAANAMPTPLLKDGTPIGGAGRGNRLLPNSTDWLGRFRMVENEANDWNIDRDAQRTNRIYSGIDGIHLQDQAITESMGPITEFELEHLAPSDQMITRTRRRLLLAARALRDQGTLPPGAADHRVYGAARSGYLVSEGERPWQDVYRHELAAAVHPPAASAIIRR